MLNCMAAWQMETGAELHIVHRNVDNAAPFQFDTDRTGIELYQREHFDESGLKTLARNLDPSLILCFGWMDKAYLSVVRDRGLGCPAVMTMDNQWLGTLRQRVGLLWSQIYIRPIFDYVWVPGPRQRRFAQKLGFAEEQIYEGLYVANNTNFDPIWQNLGGGPPAKRLIFVGRYAVEKGLDVLWEAFSTYCARTDSDLELWCVGTGPLDAVKLEHPQIRHLGFVQPADFAERLAGGGIFVLPSRFEPWGLVVQEFALAGCPLILSRNVGASEWFLRDDNGILLPKVDQESLIAAIAQVDAMTVEQLTAMADASRRRADSLTAQDWARQMQAFADGTA
jgi:glycosyltransferase involved in cell wall biosynthesis